MHGTDPFAREVGSEDLIVTGEFHADLAAGKHAGFEASIRIGDVDANRHGAGAPINVRRNEGNAAGEGFAGPGLDGERYLLAVAQLGKVRLEGLEVQPQFT